MFICEKCAEGKVDSFWFIMGPLSRGPCEICKKVSVCLDVPSRVLDGNQYAHKSNMKKEGKDERDRI